MGSTTGPRAAAQVWATAGVAILFACAVWRLGARGIKTVAGGLSPAAWLTLLLVTAVFVYGEGERALRQRYIPIVLARIERLRSERSALYRVLAPLYAMSLVGRPARSVAAAWAGVAAIVGAVLVVSRLPQPWRGIVDLAVAAALAWGLTALLTGASRMVRSDRHGE